MAYATITEGFKKTALDILLSDYNDSASNYYIGIGRSEDWNDLDEPDTITNTYDTELDFRQRLQSIKTVQNVSYVVPRVDWSAGTIYSAFDNTVSGFPASPYYVMNAENRVFVCLIVGKAVDGTNVASSVKPTDVSGKPFRTSDGYVWQYLYKIDNLGIDNYLSGNFMPVKLIDSDYTSTDYTSEDSDQYAIQQGAVAGTISSVTLVSRGSGYSTAPTVTIEGNGTGASMVARIVDGSVVSVEFDSDGSGNLEVGSGYTYATVSFNGSNTTPATARVNISPLGGFGWNPIVTLRSKALMFNSKITGIEDGKFFINQEFRQIGILRNPTEAGSSTLYTDTNGVVCSYIEYTDLEGAGFSNNKMIEGLTSGTKAYIDEFLPTRYGSRIYYHQNDTTGYGEFDSGEIVQQVGSTDNRAQISSINTGDINPLSGQLLYVENRSAVPHDDLQTEDIKIIIQL